MKNAKNERILNALGRADDRYVAEAAPAGAGRDAFEAQAVQAEQVTVAAPVRRIHAGGVAAAACACIAAGGLVFWGAVGGLGNLTEDPANGGSDPLGDYAQTAAPDENEYHDFTMTLEELHNSSLACFIPDYFPKGYQFSGEAQCSQSNGIADAYVEIDVYFWLSSGIDDPDTEGYNPIYFSVRVMNENSSVIEIDPISDVYELETLTLEDVVEMGNGGLIDCGHNVRIQVARPYPELASAEEMYKMIMSMPYARQFTDGPYQIQYLTRDEVYNTPLADYLPTFLPAGYNITGLSPYSRTEHADNDPGSISLYLSNGVEDPDLSNYCPIKYIVQPNADIDRADDKPVYQNVWALTTQDVEAAVEKGGFYIVHTGTELIEVSFPYPDRVKPGEIYMMVKSAPYAVDPNGDNDHTTVYLSREELYNCQWSMFLPRYVPKGYAFEGNASYKPTGFVDDGVLTYRFADGENAMEFVFTTDFSGSLNMETQLNLKKLSASDMSVVKSGGLIYCENGGSTLQINIDKPQLMTDEELYKTLMSIPSSDNFQATGITTVDLSEYIGIDVPAVAFEQFYDVQRVEIRTKFNERDSFLPFFDAETYSEADALDGEFGTIVGYDGKNVYFKSTGYVDGTDENGHKTSLLVRMIGMYDTANDSYTQLVRQYEGDLEFICADGKTVYYTVSAADGNNVLHSSLCRLDINNRLADGTLLTVDGRITATAVNGSSIYLAASSEGQHALVRFDMNADVDAAIAANQDYLTITAAQSEISELMPYKDGAAYILKDDARSCWYWDGRQESETALLFVTEAEGVAAYSDGEIFYCVMDGQLFTGTDYSNQTYEDKQFFDVLDTKDLSVADRKNLAYNNAVDSNPQYTFSEPANMANADGMIAPASYTGIIYDAQNGWFTHVNPDKMYWSRPCKGDHLLMLEEDEKYGLSITGDVADDYLTLCIITRK